MGWASPTRSSGPGFGRRVADLLRVRQVELLAADVADLHVELLDGAAARAAALGLVLLEAVGERGDQAEHREDEADREPEQEVAALGPADDAGGEAEAGEDDEGFHFSPEAGGCRRVRRP